MKRYPLKAPSAHFSDTVKLRAEMVQRFSLFSEIPLEDCAKIVALAHEARFAQGKAIFFAGDPLRQVVLLTSGCVKLTQSSREGEEVNLRLVGPGETLCVECFPKYTHCQWQCQAKLQPIPTGALSLDCVRVGDFSFTIPIQWGVSMRSALTFLLLAAASLLAVPASSAQTVNPQTGAVCEPQPTNMESVRSKAETGDASAEYEMGRSMLSPRPTDSELASAVPWFRRSAEQGYAPAEYMYGGVFREGRWENPDQLVYWWTKAAEQGNVHAQLWLGVFYEQGRDDIGPNYPAAFRWLSMAAKQGQPDAQVTLGQMYENGEGVPQDYGVAAYWYRKAATTPLT